MDADAKEGLGHGLTVWALVVTGLLGTGLLIGVWLPAHPDSAWRVPVALSPFLPIVSLAWLAARGLSGTDELRRKIVTDALAFAFVASGLSVVAYALLEDAGFPPLRAWWTWTGMAGFWALGWILSRHRYR